MDDQHQHQQVDDKRAKRKRKVSFNIPEAQSGGDQKENIFSQQEAGTRNHKRQKLAHEPDSPTQQQLEEEQGGLGKSPQVTREGFKYGEAYSKELPEGWEPFNVHQELAEGKFDEVGGHYIPNKEAKENDPWLREMDELQRKDKDYISKVQQSLASKSLQDHSPYDLLEPPDLLLKVTNILGNGENVFHAMRRLKPSRNNKATSKNRNKNQKVKKQDRSKASVKTASNDKGNEPSNVSDNEKTFNELVELADALFARGWSNIYNEPKEMLVQQIQQERDIRDEQKQTTSNTTDTDNNSYMADPREESIPTEGAIYWEYKWSPDMQEVYGPFDSATMASWVDAGYFDEGVVARQKTDNSNEQFISVNSIPFALYT